MRTRLIASGAAVLGVVMAAQLGAFDGDETRALPLDTVYATFRQEGVKPLDNTVNNDDLAQISNDIQKAPQVVLCVGDDIAAAVKASALSFSMPNESVPAVVGGPSDVLWVAAYLGNDGSMPPSYQVWSIEVTGMRIRVAYEQIDSATRTCDLFAYVVWAPVGRLEEGAYTLELFDVAANEVTLSRPWHVIVK